MYNAKYIIPGIIIFAVLFTIPFWYNLLAGTVYAAPELSLPAPAGEEFCVESTEFMRAEHMQLLNEWRDQVVRNGNRRYASSVNYGTEDAPVYRVYEISLQNTCMNCHTNKAEFCDKCHATVGVEPYCWTCHIEPKGN